MISGIEKKMKKTIIIICLISLTIIVLFFLPKGTPFFSSRNNDQSAGVDKYINLNRLTDKVLAINFGDDAMTAVVTQKGIVVIDAGISNSLTAFYRKAIEKEFGRNDFAYLINTHSHSDHIGGNQVFSDAVIIGHENCVKEISESWADRENKKSRLLKIANEYKNKLKTLKSSSNDWEENYCQLIRYKHAYEDLLNDRVITYPEITFDDRLNISMGDVSLDLIYFGKAHSGSDILIHIPEVKLLMIGDLFFPGGIPAIGEVNKQDAERWLYVVQWIKDRWDKIDKVIGGHGQIMNRNDLQSFNEYVEKKYEELE